MYSCTTCRLNSMLCERCCLAMAFIFRKPRTPVKSLTSTCPAPGAHSTAREGCVHAIDRRYHALAKDEQCFCAAKDLSRPCLSWVKSGNTRDEQRFSAIPPKAGI